jgi:hypothetical protein
MDLLLLMWRLAAIGCTLSNPAQDLKALFPEITSYKEELHDLSRRKDGREAYRKLQDRVGGDLDPVYEALDTPYTLYRVFKENELLGIVHGVNVPGQGGVIQVFLSTDPKTGEIRVFFFQRLESAASRELRSREFRARFQGLTLADFYKHDYYAAVEPGSEKDKVGRIPDPTPEGPGRLDFRATLRGIRKNLILLDLFVYEMRNEPYYERARESIEKKRVPDHKE